VVTNCRWKTYHSIVAKQKGGSCTRVGEPDNGKTGRPEGLPRTATKKQVAKCVQKPSENSSEVSYRCHRVAKPDTSYGRGSDYRPRDKGTAMDKCTDNSQSRVGRCSFVSSAGESPFCIRKPQYLNQRCHPAKFHNSLRSCGIR
jgi:hypothetical protein